MYKLGDALPCFSANPKNDYAFKYIFGNERWTAILIHLLNAVLKLPPGRRIVNVQILNPISQPVVLDDKLSILDIKARDQSGRIFNIEMQMIGHPFFRERVLYYWSKSYSSQLTSGEEYDQLRPVISICFLDGLLSEGRPEFRLHFQLSAERGEVVFSDHIQCFFFQLPNFTKTENIDDPLEKWLYFFNNGKSLDPANLPAFLQVPEVIQATEVLTMLTQDEIERERYEAREKARRDARGWEIALERAQRAAEHAQRAAEHAQQAAEHAQQAAERSRVEGRIEGIAESRRASLIEQIRFCEQVLKQPAQAEEALAGQSVEDLEKQARMLRDLVLRAGS